MLQGFDEHTEELSEYEHSLVPIFVRGLQTKQGKSKAITNEQMCEAMRKASHNVNPARVRKIINYIRNNGLIAGLIASSSGYYVTNDVKELKDYIDSLNGRINAIKRVKNKFEEYHRTLETKNLRLF